MKWFCALQTIFLIGLTVVALRSYSKAEELWIGAKHQKSIHHILSSEPDESRRHQMNISLQDEQLFYGRQHAGAAVVLLSLGCGAGMISSAVIALRCQFSLAKKISHPD